MEEKQNFFWVLDPEEEEEEKWDREKERYFYSSDIMFRRTIAAVTSKLYIFTVTTKSLRRNAKLIVCSLKNTSYGRF